MVANLTLLQCNVLLVPSAKLPNIGYNINIDIDIKHASIE